MIVACLGIVITVALYKGAANIVDGRSFDVSQMFDGLGQDAGRDRRES